VEDESVPIPAPPYVLRQPSYYSPPGRRHTRQWSSSEYAAPYSPTHYDQFHDGEDVELGDISFGPFREDFAALQRVRNVSEKSASTLLPSFDGVIEVCTNVSRRLYLKIDIFDTRSGRRTEQIYATAAELSGYALVLGRLRAVLSESSRLISLTAYEQINKILLSSKKALNKLESVIATSRRTPSNFFRRDRLDSSLGKARSVRLNIECLKTSLAAMTSTIILANCMKERIAADKHLPSNASLTTISNHTDDVQQSTQIYELDTAVENIIVGLENDILANSHAIARWQEAELSDYHRLYLNGIAKPVANPISPASKWIEGLIPPLPIQKTHKRMLSPSRSRALTYSAQTEDAGTSRVEVDMIAQEGRIEGVIQALLQKWTENSSSVSGQTSTSLSKFEKEMVETLAGKSDSKISEHTRQKAVPEIDHASDASSDFETNVNSVEHGNPGDTSVRDLQTELNAVLPEVASAEDADEDEDEESESTNSSRLQKRKRLFSRVSSDSGDSAKTPGNSTNGRVAFQVDEGGTNARTHMPQSPVHSEPHAVAFDEEKLAGLGLGTAATAAAAIYAQNRNKKWSEPGTRQRESDEEGELGSLPRAGWEENDFVTQAGYSSDEARGDSASSREARSPMLAPGHYWYGSAPVHGSQHRHRSRSATGSTGFAETIIDSSSEGPRSGGSRHRSGRRDRSRRYRDESAGSRSSRRHSPYQRPREERAHQTNISPSGARRKAPRDAENSTAWVDTSVEGELPTLDGPDIPQHYEETIEEQQDTSRSARSPELRARDHENRRYSISELDDPYYDTAKDEREEGDYYNTIALGRSFAGEAYNGVACSQSRLDVPLGTTIVIFDIPPHTRQIGRDGVPSSDWETLEIPPGTARVMMYGAGGGRHEITWQRYNGVRRCKFRPDGGVTGSRTVKTIVPASRSEPESSTRSRSWEAVDFLALGSMIFALGVSVAAV
jgi:hypothetical protein